MNLILLAAVVTLTSAGQLPSRNYIPQGQGQRQPGYSQGTGGYGGSESGNTRAQQAQEKNAAILKQDQAIDEGGSYHFGYETENGIRAEEAGNPVEVQGGFSYKGDDGYTYTVTYTSGEGGFRPQGEHLPIAPPIPQAILEALQENSQDEAAGIFDDGLYRPDVHGGPGLSGGPYSTGNRPGQGSQASFGGSGKPQNLFKPNSGYTY